MPSVLIAQNERWMENRLLRYTFLIRPAAIKSHYFSKFPEKLRLWLVQVKKRPKCSRLLNAELVNQLRWQLIADRNEWPNRNTIIRRFLSRLVGMIEIIEKWWIDYLFRLFLFYSKILKTEEILRFWDERFSEILAIRENWNSVQHGGNYTGRQIQAAGKPSNPSKARGNILKSPAIEQKFTPPATVPSIPRNCLAPSIHALSKIFYFSRFGRVWNLVTVISLSLSLSSFLIHIEIPCPCSIGRQTSARNLTERR